MIDEKLRRHIHLSGWAIMLICFILIVGMVSLGVQYLNKPSPSIEKQPQRYSAHLPKMETKGKKIYISAPLNFILENSISTEHPQLRVKDIYVDVGDNVKKGEVLATLDDTTLKAEYQVAKAAYGEAAAKHHQAAETARGARELLDGKAISQNQIRQYIATEKITSANLEAAAAQMELKRIRMDQAKIKAPANGIVMERNIFIGQIVGSSSLFRVATEERMVWRPSVDFDDVDDIRKTMMIHLDLEDGPVKVKIKEILPALASTGKKSALLIPLDRNTLKDKVHSGMLLHGVIDFDMKVPTAVISKKDIHNGRIYVFRSGKPLIVQLSPSQEKDFEDLVSVPQVRADDLIVETPSAFVLDSDFMGISMDRLVISEMKNHNK